MTDATSAPPPQPHHGWRTRTKLLLLGFLISPLVILALWSVGALWFSYSDGYRAGILQKFSHKGWVCKTSEGELAQAVVQGIAPLIWDFSVRDPNIERQLDTLVGRKVSLHYVEHRGIPTSCFGSTTYFVDSVTVLRE
ncbi:MAG: hypothetical protein ABI765_02520 [Gemmatimonadota bacterium]